MGRVWRETFSRSANPAKGSGIIGLWWTAWIVSAVILVSASFVIRGAPPNAELTMAVRQTREVFWAMAALGYGLRGACALLLLAVFSPLVRGQRDTVDVSAFD